MEQRMEIKEISPKTGEVKPGKNTTTPRPNPKPRPRPKGK